jgi:hypothetical protein
MGDGFCESPSKVSIMFMGFQDMTLLRLGLLWLK